MAKFFLAAVVSEVLASVVLAVAQQPEIPASIDGQVTGASGQPLRKAGLTLRAAGPGGAVYTADSDAAGKFSFAGIKPGGYTLSAERPGYLRTLYRAGPYETFSTITVAAGEHRGINLTLDRAAAISGRVLDQDGDPVAKVSVRLLQRRYQSGPNLMEGRSVYTDNAGRYEIPDLPPGQYYLSAGPGYGAVFSILGQRVVNGPAPGETPEYYATTFYPNGRDQTAARPIQVLHDDMQGMDIRLLKTPAFRVRGKVVGTIPGHPLEQCRIALAPADPPSTPMMGIPFQGTAAMMAKDGSFEVPGQHFPPGDYFIIATSPGAGRGLVLARQPLTIGNQDIDNTVLNLQPLVELRGRVTIEGEPQTDFSSFPGVNPPPTVTMQISLSLMHGPKLNDIRTKIQSDGSFTLGDIAPGTYEVNVFGKPSGCWVKSIHIGSREALESGIDISGADRAPLEITLSRTVGQIAGVVETDQGKPAARSTVTLFREPPGKESISSGVGENGEFTLQQVAPGTYRIYAWEDLETAQRYDPQLLDAYKSRSVRVTVRENGRERVTLSLIPSEADPKQ